MYNLDYQQQKLEEQPFTNYIYSFDYILRGKLVKIAILSYQYESEVDSMCYNISSIRYLVLDECDRFLYASENVTDDEDYNIQEYFCMLQDYSPNGESDECWF